MAHKKAASPEDPLQRLRRLLSRRKGIAEKPMIGGICFLADGQMACGVNAKGLLVRVGPRGPWGSGLRRPGWLHFVHKYCMFMNYEHSYNMNNEAGPA